MVFELNIWSGLAGQGQSVRRRGVPAGAFRDATLR
jgi:hypothetical protein